MTSPLDGSVALVTGASSGIGAATARKLSLSGASVALVARRKDRLDELAAELGAQTLVIEDDMTNQAAAAAAVEQTVDQFGLLDIVINNAGVMLLGPIEDAPVEEWDRMIDLNLKGALYVAHASLPHLLKAATSGREVADLVNISSTAGRQTRAGSGVYNLTKHGLGAFSDSLRQEVTERHVRVSLVEPGATATELRDHLRPEIRNATQARFETVERLAAEDIADTIDFIVTRPRRMAVNEVLVRPTEQV